MTSTTRLFVGNIPENIEESNIQAAFSIYGEITNIDIKSKPNVENDKKRFAFVTLSTSENCIESCLRHFSNEPFHGNMLYVTRARESFLERLQREREQNQMKEVQPIQELKANKSDIFFNENKTNKRKFLNDEDTINEVEKNVSSKKKNKAKLENDISYNNNYDIPPSKTKPADKKNLSEQKRLESMRRKRQEFKEKKMIIKTGLTSIDKAPNKKIVFSDTEDNNSQDLKALNGSTSNSKKDLFEDQASDDDITFDIKEQFEGEKGQKVLDLQSRYKSDKRFVLDKRFIEESDEENKSNNSKDEVNEDESVELEQADEKSKQVKILQDVLGVTIRPKQQDSSSKTKAKLGMLRFDPLQPDHAKFLAPVEPKQDTAKKSKKKKSKDKEETVESEPIPEVPKVEVSKEQFYEVSEVLKEAIAQPTSFSLRSLFSKNLPAEDEEQNDTEEHSIPIEKTKDKKVKNPLDPGEKNPFVYDSSESENEDDKVNTKSVQLDNKEVKAVWKENLFLSQEDFRLKEGLEFFNKPLEGEIPKDRRQLKSVMKKRLYNKERKNKMFQKKIGGRKKNMKKSYSKRP